MDYQQNGPLQRAVMILMLVAIHWSLVMSAPSTLPLTCQDERTSTISILKQLQDETTWLHNEYINTHGPMTSSIPDEVPDSIIFGHNVMKKLQSIYSKAMLFKLHIHKIKHYHEYEWGNTELIAEVLNDVTHRCGFFVTKMQFLLKTMESNIDFPPTPPPLDLSHTNRYDIKVYGWAVLDRLKEWLVQVDRVLHQVDCTEHGRPMQEFAL